MNSRGSVRSQPPVPENRIVLLGASNLTMYLRTVIGFIQQRCGAPGDVLAAAGHGRSYGKYSQVLIRGLPGIASSGLWRALDVADAVPTYAFLTDIGNDIAYGYPPDQVLQWVDTCVGRLQQHAARIVMTNLPIASIEAISEAHFRIVRSILFPSSRLSHAEVVARARILYRGLQEMAADRNFDLCEQDRGWLGPDRIHIPHRKHKEAYGKILSRFPPTGGTRAIAKGDIEPAANWNRRPRFAYETVMGWELRCHQPSGRLTDGTTVSLY